MGVGHDVLDWFVELEPAEKFKAHVGIVRAVKFGSLGFMAVKSALLIAVTQIPPRVPLLQSVLVLSVVGIVFHLFAFAGVHFKIKNVSLLYVLMDTILGAAEVAVTANVARAIATTALGSEPYFGLLLAYICLFGLNIVVLVLSLVFFIRLYKQEEEEEEREQREKERQEAAEEEARTQALMEAKAKRREQRRLERVARKELETAALLGPGLGISPDLMPLQPPHAGALIRTSSGGRKMQPDPAPAEVSPHPHAASDDL